MSAPDDPSFSVSVFHFTSRISSAKIRKYKSATEKGMGPSTGNGRTPTPGPSTRKSVPSTKQDAKASEEPPAKKQRLKLNVRDPGPTGQSLSPDTIAVSRPRRGSSLRVQYSENMDVDDAEVTKAPGIHKPRAASAASTASSLTSFSSVESGEKGPKPAAAEGGKKPAKAGDYNRDFLSYYVTGDADDEDEDEGKNDAPPTASVKSVAVSKPQPSVQPPTVHGSAAVQPSAGAQASRPPPQPQVHRETKFRNHTGPPLPYPTSARERPPSRPVPPPPAQPCVHLIDNMNIHNAPGPTLTVTAMVAKLAFLSNELARFGGGPPPRSSSPGPQRSMPMPMPTSANADQGPSTNSNPRLDLAKTQAESTQQASKSAADGLLAMFDDDDDEESDDDANTEASASRPDQLAAVPAAQAPAVTTPVATTPAATEASIDESAHALDDQLKQSGDQDAALYYGIKFIQNALRSWARQRLNTEYSHFYWTEHQKYRDQLQPQRRGPGRPRKFEDDEAYKKLPPADIRMDLAHTNEGRAIAAFQDVLDGGCLQVNTNLPIELSRALRILYAQIDQLINQEPRYDMPWQCLSYDVQITANKIRVDEWKEARARAQAEMERQQMLAQQQVMQQMGIRSRRPGSSDEQVRQAHAVDLERRRGNEQAAQQTHQSPYAPNLMPPAGQVAPAVNTPVVPSLRMSNGPTTSSPNAGTSTVNGVATISHLPNPRPIPSSPASMNGVQLDKIEQLMPSNLLSRSGQSMKFSFPPKNELASKVFGPQAFPVNQNGSSLPNRGPMGAGRASPSIQLGSSPRLPNGAGAAITATSQQSPPARPVLPEQPSDTIQVASRPSSRQTSRSSPTIAQQQVPLVNGSGSVYPNQSPKAAASTSAPNPVPASPSKASSSVVPNGSAVADDELASRFPHPGAVIVNE